jgi:hypothetical protein
VYRMFFGFRSWFRVRWRRDGLLRDQASSFVGTSARLPTLFFVGAHSHTISMGHPIRESKCCNHAFVIGYSTTIFFVGAHSHTISMGCPIRESKCCNSAFFKGFFFD